MSMTMAVVDRAALEQLRAARTENADVQAAVATLERALNGSEGRKLLTTTDALALDLGVQLCPLFLGGGSDRGWIRLSHKVPTAIAAQQRQDVRCKLLRTCGGRQGR